MKTTFKKTTPYSVPFDHLEPGTPFVYASEAQKGEYVHEHTHLKAKLSEHIDTNRGRLTSINLHDMRPFITGPQTKVFPLRNTRIEVGY